ncbi:hypothetical protein HK097_011551 [Rhizophlyctis rosea]|uniref:Uncharacterized protein n=1 Tax=Rhizophlyctis rosea TaxID=64517 RepID=A0AAD5S660_9FUNG|nr:hypothetical protein HK097_011551 [Rhizophlyctis rosea]
MRPIIPASSPAAEGDSVGFSSQALTLYQKKPSLFSRITGTFSSVTNAVLDKVPAVAAVFKDEKYFLKSKAHRNRSLGAIEKPRKTISFDKRRSSFSVPLDEFTAQMQPVEAPSTPVSVLPPAWFPSSSPVAHSPDSDRISFLERRLVELEAQREEDKETANKKVAELEAKLDATLKRKVPESPKLPGMAAVLEEMKSHKLRKVIRSPGGTAERSKLKRPMHAEDYFADALRKKFRKANSDDESSRNDTEWEESTDEICSKSDTVRRTLFKEHGRAGTRIIPRELTN